MKDVGCMVVTCVNSSRPHSICSIYIPIGHPHGTKNGHGGLKHHTHVNENSHQWINQSFGSPPDFGGFFLSFFPRYRHILAIIAQL